jgi:hypothetical protein
MSSESESESESASDETNSESESESDLNPIDTANRPPSPQPASDQLDVEILYGMVCSLSALVNEKEKELAKQAEVIERQAATIRKLELGKRQRKKRNPWGEEEKKMLVRLALSYGLLPAIRDPVRRVGLDRLNEGVQWNVIADLPQFKSTRTSVAIKDAVSHTHARVATWIDPRRLTVTLILICRAIAPFCFDAQFWPLFYDYHYMGDPHLKVGASIDFAALANGAFDLLASDTQGELVNEERYAEVKAWQRAHRIPMRKLRYRGSPWASPAEELKAAHAQAHPQTDALIFDERC